MTIAAKVMAKAPEGRRVTIEVRATNQHGELAMAASAEIVAPKTTIAAVPREEFVEQMHEKGRRYKILDRAHPRSEAPEDRGRASGRRSLARPARSKRRARI